MGSSGGGVTAAARKFRRLIRNAAHGSGLILRSDDCHIWEDALRTIPTETSYSIWGDKLRLMFFTGTRNLVLSISRKYSNVRFVIY